MNKNETIAPQCQDCGGPTYGDEIFCDRCRYTEDDAVDLGLLNDEQ